jgi:hypothetical protein
MQVLLEGVTSGKAYTLLTKKRLKNNKTFHQIQQLAAGTAHQAKGFASPLKGRDESKRN